MTQAVVHISNSGGHRQSYLDLFTRLLSAEPSSGPIRARKFWELIRADIVFFVTIDDDYPGFFAVAILRALQCKPTAGLFLRPMQCFRTERRIVYGAKRFIFRWICKLHNLHLLSIISHERYPELAQVSHDWIYDPQMWDLWVDGAPELPQTELSRNVESKKFGREVMIFIGKGNRLKGFPEFVECARKNSNGMVFVLAGKIDPEYSDYVTILRELGAIVEDRFVSDEEILSLYKIADYAWCYYAIDYDQASGVFGRALQTGVKPIVRPGSFLDFQLTQLGHRYAESGKVEIARDLSLNRIFESTNSPLFE